MNRFVFLVLFFLFVVIFCSGCGKEDNEFFIGSPYISGLTTDNYPSVDGSTSAYPLNIIIAGKLFDIGYKWEYTGWGIREVQPIGNGSNNKMWSRIKASQTHNSFINLIDKKADIILSARTMSSDEIEYAESKGISLIETEIALDAFIFIVSPYSQIESLTANQILDIYTGKITDWNEVGTFDGIIKPYIRNANSGSQELFEYLVIKDLDIIEFPISNNEVLFNMTGALDAVAYDYNAICFTLYYYLEYIARGNKDTVKTIAVDGKFPNRETIRDKIYPYVAPVYVVIRSDLDTSSMSFRIYEWLQTEHGQQVINESGYVPLSVTGAEFVRRIVAPNDTIDSVLQ
jgi:phosphate transport system substrate-binding protein